MSTVLQIYVLLMMTAVGIGLTTLDFSRLGEKPHLMVIAPGETQPQDR